MTADSLRVSPLDAEHRALGARMAEFGGWEMPIQYESVLDEHRACRERAVVFDVSHLGSVRVHGAGAFATLQWAFTNDLDRVGPAHAQYTHLLDPDDAHVVDDIIVWWVAPGEFLVMPNASNTTPLIDALDEAALFYGAGECTVADVTSSRVVLAVQGPAARELLARSRPMRPRCRASRSCRSRMPVAPRGIAAGHRVHRRGRRGAPRARRRRGRGVARVARHGVGARGPRRSRHVAARGRASPARPRARTGDHAAAGRVGLGGALGQGRLPRACPAGSGEGARRGAPAARSRARLTAGPARGIPGAPGRHPVGEVSSGNFSPVLERGIALAFLTPDLAIGDDVVVDVRGRPAHAIVTKLPFVSR